MSKNLQDSQRKYVVFVFSYINPPCLWKESLNWWSSPISTKRTITSHLHWTHWTQKRPGH